MIDINVAKNILVKTKKSKDKLSESICLFKEFLGLDEALDRSKYYLARTRLQDGQTLLDEALNDARKLLGPRPEYAPEKINATRIKILRESRVIVDSQTIDGLEAELLADEYVKSFMNSDKVVSYVREVGTYRTTEKRKIQNIKVRMVIDQLIALRAEAQAWQQRAGEKILAK